MQGLKKKTIKGVVWSGVETFATSALNFIFSILLARILMPEDFGTIAILAFFMQLAQIFVDSGLSNALIRKQNRSIEDESTAFWSNIAIGLIAYIFIFIFAPYIAEFYNIPTLTEITRIYAIVIILNSFSVVHRAIISSNLNFKLLTKISLTSSIVSGIIALCFAVYGLGIWTLVILNAVSSAISTFLLWFYNRWKPKFIFSLKSFKEMFGFGYKLLFSGLIDTTFNNLYSLIIGKIFSPLSLGYYSKADSLSGYPARSITHMIQRATYPSLSKLQSNDQSLELNYRKILRLSAYIIFPIMIGISAIADPLIQLLLTDKWNDTTILLQLLCLSFMWYPIHALNLNLLQVKGRSDLFLKLEIIKKIVGLTILFATIPFGIVWICIGRVFNSMIALIINTYYTGKLINVKLSKQITDILPSLINALVMGVICYLSLFLSNILWLKVILAVIIGFIYYFCSSFITKSKELNEIILILKNK